MYFNYYWKRHWNNNKVIAFLQGRYFIPNNILINFSYTSLPTTYFLDTPILSKSNDIARLQKLNAQAAFICLYNEGLIRRKQYIGNEPHYGKVDYFEQHDLKSSRSNWSFDFTPIREKMIWCLQEKYWIGAISKNIIIEINRLENVILNSSTGNWETQIPIIYCEECGETTVPIEMITENHLKVREIKCPYCRGLAVWDNANLTNDAMLRLSSFARLIQEESIFPFLLRTTLETRSLRMKDPFLFIAMIIWTIIKKRTE